MAVARFVAGAERSGLLDADTDYGDPQVTDMGFTRVWSHGATGERRVSLYAFSASMDEYLHFWQRRNRQRLRTLISEARGLTGDAEREHVPDRVRVYEISSRNASREAMPWPGPDPATFLHPATTRTAIACGELTGPAALAVYRAALDNPGQRWRVDGTTRVLVVNPLPLGLDC